MESVLHEAGVCGRFQICHVTLVQLCRLVTAWATFLMMYGLYNPGWRCPKAFNTGAINLNDSTNVNTSALSSDAFHVSFGNKALSFNNATQGVQGNAYGGIVNVKVTDSDDNDYHTGSCSALGSCGGGGIEFNPESSTVVTEFGLICGDAWIGHFMVSSVSCGMLLGAFVWGYVGERYGRRIALYGSHFIMGLSCGLAVLSPLWQVYAAFNFFIGFGGVGVMNSTSVLCMEFISTKWRARVSAIPVWNAGTLCFAAAMYILKDWKEIHLACALVCGITCLGFFWTEESWRWLLIHGKTSKARKVLEKMARVNRGQISGEAFTKLVINNKDEETDRRYTYLDLFRTRELRFTTIKLCFIWVISMLVYELIGFGLQALPGDFYTNFVVASLIEFPGVLLNGILANRIGRRWTGILFMSIGAMCCTVIVVALVTIENSDVRDIVIPILAFIDRSVMQAILSFIISYSAELIPTAVRNLAFGSFNIAVRVSGIFSPYMLPTDYSSMIACFSVLMASQIVAVALFYSLAETKNKPLTETIYTAERGVTEEYDHNESKT